MRRCWPRVVPGLPPTGARGVGSLKPSPGALTLTMVIVALAKTGAAASRRARRTKRVRWSLPGVRITLFLLEGRRGVESRRRGVQAVDAGRLQRAVGVGGDEGHVQELAGQADRDGAVGELGGGEVLLELVAEERCHGLLQGLLFGLGRLP